MTSRAFGFLGALFLVACSRPVAEAPPVARAVLPVIAAPVAPPATVEEETEPAPDPEPPPPPPSACNEQPPQEFLIRSSYVYTPGASREEAEERRQMASKSIEYRTRRYGYVDGYGDPKWNRSEPKAYTSRGTFFGIGIRMNKRVLVALGCVEEAIKQTCSATPYTPHKLDTLRFKNTFHNNEVSNHTYGIAIDVDWDTNPCCGCVAPLNADPRCKEPSTTPFDRTAIPKCWVDTFEKYGFYWLGHDQLEDTMHFEFLGDPSKIERAK